MIGRRRVFGALILVLLASYLGWSAYVMAATPEPAYSVVETTGNIEIRRYAPMIAAEVEVDGDRKSGVSQGFRALAGYIFGGNTKAEKIAMTAPVTQQSGEKIAMTAPVTQEQIRADTIRWRVRFIMPEGSTLATLPKPNDSRVKLIELPEQRVAAIRFSGWWSDGNFAENRDRLLAFLREKNLTPTGNPVFAYYSPPSTLPFWRRNEVMVQLAAP